MSNAHQASVSARRGARIGSLANLPVFFKLDGKRVLVVGGGEPALWKAELLAATGALVEVFAEAFSKEFFALAEAPPNGQIVLARRKWSTEDLKNAALAVGSFADGAEAAAFAAAARAAGVPVNVVDRPAFCDFQFGAIVNRSPLVVGISTDGAAPVFGQAIRSLVESLLPESFQLWARAARDLRRDSDRFGDTLEQKRRFWRRFTDFALRHLDRGPEADDIAQLIAGEPAARTEAVTVIVVDKSADTLTLGAVRALRAADDIFYDEDVPNSVLDFARREARRHPLASEQGFDASAVITSAKSGGQVVRLRLNANAGGLGDEQELEALRAAGISVVVPPS
ncbi:MAG: siroheme synthase [Proteobacteria bacterium]|nr:siroheme synthase [Pseudomonadota bacterium]